MLSIIHLYMGVLCTSCLCWPYVLRLYRNPCPLQRNWRQSMCKTGHLSFIADHKCTMLGCPSVINYLRCERTRYQSVVSFDEIDKMSTKPIFIWYDKHWCDDYHNLLCWGAANMLGSLWMIKTLIYGKRNGGVYCNPKAPTTRW